MKITQPYTPEQQRRIDELRAMSPDQWDSICRRCGVCCLNNIEINGKNFYMDLGCGFLDCQTHQCRVYKNRFSRCSSCTKATLDVVLDGILMPESCAYREYIFGPAPNPANVDWTKIGVLAPFQKYTMDKQERMRHLIQGSDKWNVR